jgi:hypothetical protein
MTSAITPQRLVVTVSVGARHTAVELAEVLRSKDTGDDAMHATVVANLGQIAGDESRAQGGFGRATLDETAADLARTARMHGEPCMREVAELAARGADAQLGTRRPMARSRADRPRATR